MFKFFQKRPPVISGVSISWEWACPSLIGVIEALLAPFHRMKKIDRAAFAASLGKFLRADNNVETSVAPAADLLRQIWQETTAFTGAVRVAFERAGVVTLMCGSVQMKFWNGFPVPGAAYSYGVEVKFPADGSAQLEALAILRGLDKFRAGTNYFCSEIGSRPFMHCLDEGQVLALRQEAATGLIKETQRRLKKHPYLGERLAAAEKEASYLASPGSSTKVPAPAAA